MNNPTIDSKLNTGNMGILFMCKFNRLNRPVHPGFPADLVHLTIGYASVFVLLVFKRGEMYVERRDGRVA